MTPAPGARGVGQAEPRFLHDIVTRAARSRPDDLALAFGEQRWTFAELDQRIERLAGSLRRHGAPGDRVAIVAPNQPAWADCYYGVPRARLVLAFVNHRLSPEQMRAAIERVRPVVLFAGTAELAAMAALPDGPPDVPSVVELGRGDAYDRFLAGSAAPTSSFRSPGSPGTSADTGGPEPSASSAHTGSAATDPPQPSTETGEADGCQSATSVPTPDAPPDQPTHSPASPGDTAWLIATSGTSGLPKQVELSHDNLLAAVRVTAGARPTAPDDVYLFPFPMCHVAGYNALQFQYHGCPVVVMPRFDAADLVRLVHEHGVTTMSLAPTMIHALVDRLETTGEQLPTVRSISYGSGPIAPTLLKRALALLDVDFQQGYGMTELAGNAGFLGGDEHRAAVGDRPQLLHAAGKAGPGVELAVLDDDGTVLAAGTAGEIAVRGPQVTKGYWEAPEANATAFVDGWFRTGDIGRFDDDGYLYVIDRKKDIIITGGENVSSREVEDLLVQHPDVREAAVVGVPDERWGEAVCAVIVANPGATVDSDDVLAYGRTAIGGFKKPRHALVVDELPRNLAGKVLKRDLRTFAADRLKGSSR